MAFLGAGDDKREALGRVLAGDEALPAAHVRPLAGEVRWLVDAAAAGRAQTPR